MEYLSFGLSLVAILVAIYYFATKNHNLFKKHGLFDCSRRDAIARKRVNGSLHNRRYEVIDPLFRLG